MKKIAIYVGNFVLLAVIGWTLYTKGPVFYNSFKMQNAQVENFEVPLVPTDTASAQSPQRSISSDDPATYSAHVGPIFNLLQHNRNVVVVFWLTTCGFCTIELEKLNNMIKSGQISADSVLAVSIGEDAKVVTDVTKARGYLFRVAVDADQTLSTRFRVRGTPTVVFINANRTIEWYTMGTNAGLVQRVQDFIN